MDYNVDEKLTLLINMMNDKYYKNDILDLEYLVNDLNAIEGEEVFEVNEVQQFINFNSLERTNISKENIKLDL